MNEKGISRAIGLDEDLIKDLIPGLITELNQDIEEAIHFFNAGELKSLGERVHKIKGTAKCYGLDAIVENSLSIEKCIEEESEDLMDYVERLRKEITSLEASLLN